MEMTQRDLDEFIGELASGKYRQGQYRLEQNGTFCCLGVLSVLHYKSVGLKRHEFRDGTVVYFFGDKIDNDRDRQGIGVHPLLGRKLGCEVEGCMIPATALTEEELRKIRYNENSSRGWVGVMGLNDMDFPFTRIAELLPYGVTVIDNYTDRNLVRPPLSSHVTELS